MHCPNCRQWLGPHGEFCTSCAENGVERLPDPHPAAPFHLLRKLAYGLITIAAVFFVVLALLHTLFEDPDGMVSYLLMLVAPLGLALLGIGLALAYFARAQRR